MDTQEKFGDRTRLTMYWTMYGGEAGPAAAQEKGKSMCFLFVLSNMALKTVVLQGNVKEKISYEIGLAENIIRGQWQVAVASVAFQFNSRTNTFLTLSSNQVQQQHVLPSGEVYLSPTVLAVVHCRGSAGNRTLLSFKQRDMFTINAAQRKLELSFATAQPGEELPDVHALILLLLQRVH